SRSVIVVVAFFSSFLFNHPAPTEIYTLSLHDALPILASLVTDVAGMIETISLAESLEGKTAASALALDALNHLNMHLETMTFEFLYGTTADREVVREAVFGPRATEEDEDEERRVGKEWSTG